MEFRVLGPLEVHDDDGAGLALGGPRPRALLTLLLLHPNEVVSTDRLIDGIWGEAPPASAQGALQVHVHALRKALGSDRIVTRPPGYVLRVEADELDARRFERLVADGDFRAALALWRGPALADVAYEPFARAEAARLEEARLAALESRIDEELERGAHAMLVGELESLVSAHPHRERLQAQRMLALYRSGRQADALAAYRAARSALDELGLEPSAELRALERRMLAQDPQLVATPVPTTPSTPLVGRALDVTTVAALLGGARLVTITGPGGIGKTAVARAVAEQVAAAPFVELASAETTAAAVTAVAQALDADVDPTRDPLDVVAEALSGGRMVVLDNLEQIDGAGELVAELLDRVPDLVVLATSRRSLRLASERDYRLRPLEIPAPTDRTAEELVGIASVELYVARARAVVPDFGLTEANAASVGRICRLVDGLPLGVELAAARLRVLGPEQTAERLGEGIGLLRRAAPDTPVRQQSVRAAIDWSYRLLPDNERRCFRALGILAGGGSLDLVEALCAGVDSVEALEVLLDASLVEHEADSDGEPRFSMLQPIREYALELLDAHGELPEARDRHLEHLLAVAVDADERRRTDVVSYPRLRFRQELNNFRTALDHAERSGRRDEQLRLTVALAIYWTLDELVDEAVQRFERALAGEPVADPWLRFHLQNGLSMFTYLTGDTGRAFELSELALATSPEAGLPPGDLGRALRLRSSIANAAGRPDEALAALEDAIPLLEQAGDQVSAGRSLVTLADAHRRQGDFARAFEWAARGVDLLRESGDDEGQGFGLLVLGVSRVGAGEFEAASESVHEALAVARAAGDVTTVESCLLIAARVAAGVGELELAGKLLGFAEAAYERRGEARWEIEREYWEPTAEAVRAGLGADALRRLTAQGAGLSLDVAASLVTR